MTASLRVAATVHFLFLSTGTAPTANTEVDELVGRMRPRLHPTNVFLLKAMQLRFVEVTKDLGDDPESPLVKTAIKIGRQLWNGFRYSGCHLLITQMFHHHSPE